MSNPDENEPPDAPPARTDEWRMFRLIAAGLAGGGVTCLIPGLYGLRSEYGVFAVVLCAWVAMPFAFPLGFAVGLYVADRRRGVRGPVWPAVALSYAGMLLAVGVHLLVPSHEPGIGGFVRTAYGGGLGFLLSIAGGLVGHLRSRRRDSGTQ